MTRCFQVKVGKLRYFGEYPSASVAILTAQRIFGVHSASALRVLP